MSRASTSTGVSPPTRSICRSSKVRRIFTCTEASISLISSRKSEPPSAFSKRPMRRSIAPVNAPFSWPKSSLSRMFCESAAQCTATNGPFDRGPSWWIALATSSLPVPLSPWISTVAREPATWRMVSKTSCMAGERPIMFSSPYLSSSCSRSRSFSSSIFLALSTRSSTSSNLSRLIGLVMKSVAPCCIASTASSTSP